MRKFRVCVWLENDVLALGKLTSSLDNPRLFTVTLRDGEFAEPDTFKRIILKNKPNLLDYPGIDQNADAKMQAAYAGMKSRMKVMSWSLIESHDGEDSSI